MTIKDRWHSFILPYIHRAMEVIRNDSDTSFDEWKKITKNYEDTTGKKYERSHNETKN